MKKTPILQRMFDELHQSHTEDAKVFIKPQYRSLFNGVIDKYSDSAHCIYELLQNADDANATKVELILCYDKLIFIHDGNVRFTVSDPKTEEEDRRVGRLGHINSITSIGFSTKNFEKENSENKIGKFGVGFKAIFQYTTTPYIYDDPFCFKIENFIVPTEIERGEFYQKGKTTFVIPFDREDMSTKQAYDEIENKILTMEYPQLFLHNLRNISWKTETKSGIITKKISKSYDPMYSITPTLYNLKNTNGNARKILLLTKKVYVPDWGMHTIALGYFLDSRGRIKTDIRPKIHCFFPTSESIETCYVIHAPFALVDNREQIKKDNAINTNLFTSIGKMAARSLLVLRDISIIEGKYLLNDNILDLMSFNLCNMFPNKFKFIPELNRPNYEEFYNEVYSHENVFLSRNGNYIPKDQGRWSQGDLLKLLSCKQLNELIERHHDVLLPTYDFILCSINSKRQEELDSIHVIRFTDNDLASGITSRFMENQTIEWLDSFYDYVITKRLVEQYQIKKGIQSDAIMRFANIVKTESGKFIAPYSELGVNVYFTQDCSIPLEKTISSSLYQNCPSFSKLLGKLDIKAPSQIDFIRLKLEKQDVLNKEEENDLLILIVQTFRNASLSECCELSKIVNTKYLFACHRFTEGGNRVCCKSLASNVCKNDKDLELYYQLTGLENKYFLDMNFYSKLFSVIDNHELSDFFSTLDFINRPQFIEENVYLSPLEKENRPNYRICNKNVKSIEGLSEVFEIISGKTKYASLSHYIWNMLCYYVEEEQDLFINDYSEYQYYSLKRYSWPDSSLRVLLCTNKWLFINGQMRSIRGKVYSEDYVNNGYEYNAKLFEAFGIESSPKVKERESIAQMSAETNEIFLMGELAKKLGVKNSEDMRKILIAGFEITKKEKEKKELNEKKLKERQETANQLPQRKIEKALTGKDFNSPNNERAKSSHVHSHNMDTMNLDEVLAGFEEKVTLQKQEFEEVLSLKDLASTSVKYSYVWLKTLMELEVRSQGKSDANGKKTIFISFEEIVADAKADNILVLRGASRSIPTIIEDIDEIPITFFYKDGQKINITFDVASVKDDYLILKGNSKQLKAIKKVKEDAILIFKATLEVERPIELIKYWQSLIDNLEFEDEFSIKNNLRTDLKFIFGPPGTGKTTELSKRIIDIMVQKKTKCKILVLAPTNKACDVLTEKILDSQILDDAWLWRFVSTMSERVEQEELVYDRSSDITLQRKVCVISTVSRYSFDGFDTGLLNQIDWDYVIIDEASMIPLYQIIPILYNNLCKNITIAGDPFQIEPIVQIEEWKSENVYSLVNLSNFVSHTTEPIQFDVETLMTQYRSIPTIGEIYSQYMYGGKLMHNRTESSHRILQMGVDESPLNIVSFPVTRETIFEAKHLGYSNIQLYSTIFTVEFIKYISSNLYQNHRGENIKIGVLSPYGAEVQAIEKMFNQNIKQYETIEVICGTTHGFQGDECDVVIAVMNPPASGLKRTADLTFINKANILNVAISRAKDYLFVLIPSKEYECFDSLYEIKKLGKIMSSLKCKFYSSDDLEQKMFNQTHYIENNTFVTTHQTTNVYSDPFAKYEVRIDENAMDIQINDDF